MRALVTGATGFVGRRLALSLREAGADVRCLVRDRTRAGEVADAGMELHQGDVLDAPTRAGAGHDVDVAYYLVHSMGRGADRDFEAREATAAANFARMATDEGVGRVVYLGGLGDDGASAHLRSRHRTARTLREQGPPLTYFRAAMVVGPESESYRTLRYLVERLPVMIAPAWLRTPTQPIWVGDVVAYLRQAPAVAEAAGREVQIGGPDVLSYGAMVDRMAAALGRRVPVKMPTPVLSPWLSSKWIGLVTPVDAAVVRPLIEGLTTETVVTDPVAAQLFGEITPIGFDEALRRSVTEDARQR